MLYVLVLSQIELNKRLNMKVANGKEMRPKIVKLSFIGNFKTIKYPKIALDFY